MEETILFVDDEQYVLNAVTRAFADENFHLRTVTTPREALSIVREEEVAVVVTDNLMPGTRGIDLLEAVKRISPDTLKIIMTGFADLPTAIEAINIGEVFRFVVKPWKNEELIQVINDAVSRYRVVKSLRKADDMVILSIAQTIELKDPNTKGHCDRVARYALLIADVVDLPEKTKREIKYGSWLHDCGKIGVPEAILNFPGKLGSEEFETVKKHSQWGAEVARLAQLSETVVNIIRHHHEHYDGLGYPAGLCGTDIPLEARIVAVADVYDALTSKRPNRRPYGWRKALGVLDHIKGNHLDPELVEILKAGIIEAHREKKKTVRRPGPPRRKSR